MEPASRRDFAKYGARLCCGLAAARLSRSAPAVALTPAGAHAELANGNARFVAGHARHPHSSLKWLRRTAREGQHPHTIVLCCSDSRVSPEILFDQGLGDLFVVRVAGNVLREAELGSIEYAVEHLHVPLCVVLSHTGCGAVASVVAGEHLPDEVDHLVAPIREAEAAVRARLRYPLSSGELLSAVAREHARRTTDRIGAANSLLAAAMASERLRAEAALYDLSTGRVQWL